MSKTQTKRTNRIRSRMQRARHAALTTGGGIHVRKVWPSRAKPAEEQAVKPA